ncbi:MAG: tetratricopeptide repeat protein [bacterium]
MKKIMMILPILILFALTAVYAADDFDKTLKEGVKLLDLSKYDESLKYFKKALEMQPQNAMVHYYIGRNYYYMRDFDIALEHLEKSIKLKPDYADGHCYLGYALAAKGDEMENSGLVNKTKGYYMKIKAKAPMSKALELEPTNACANTGLARADIFFKNWKEAKQKCEVALKTEPKRTTAMIYLGWAYFGLNDEKNAVKWLQKAAGLIPKDDAWAHFMIGDIYATFKLWNEALPFVEKALKIDPDYERGNGKKRLAEIKKHLK